MLSADHPYLYPGEIRKLKVNMDRRDGFDEPVEIEVASLLTESLPIHLKSRHKAAKFFCIAPPCRRERMRRSR